MLANTVSLSNTVSCDTMPISARSERRVVRHRLDGRHEAQRDGEEGDEHLGAQRRGVAEGEARADPEDHHDHHAAEHFSDGTGETREALGAEHTLAVAVGEPLEAIQL